jgi:hypothetical protein
MAGGSLLGLGYLSHMHGYIRGTENGASLGIQATLGVLTDKEGNHKLLLSAQRISESINSDLKSSSEQKNKVQELIGLLEEKDQYFEQILNLETLSGGLSPGSNLRSLTGRIDELDDRAAKVLRELDALVVPEQNAELTMLAPQGYVKNLELELNGNKLKDDTHFSP